MSFIDPAEVVIIGKSTVGNEDISRSRFSAMVCWTEKLSRAVGAE